MKNNGQSDIFPFFCVFHSLWQINLTASWPTVPPHGGKETFLFWNFSVWSILPFFKDFSFGFREFGLKMRCSKNLILGMEPRFHADRSKNRWYRGLCTYCVHSNIWLFSFLLAANTFSMPHLLINLILMILLFYRTILSCLESEKCAEFNFTM